MDNPKTSPHPDILTVAAIAIVAYALSNIAHEGAGHGGACVLVHCSPHLLTSMQFDGDTTQISDAARKVIAAGGTIANLIVAALALVLWRRARTGKMWFFGWLLTTISLLQATGYLLFSGLGNVGDWAEVIRDLPGSLAWHVALAVVGGSTYWLATRWSMRRLGSHLSATNPVELTRAAYRYALTAYFTGGALYVIAGALDPAGPVILLISGVAASFGGTSGLAWGPQLLRGPFPVSGDRPLLVLPRNWTWIAVGTVCAIAYVAILGPGLRF